MTGNQRRALPLVIAALGVICAGRSDARSMYFLGETGNAVILADKDTIVGDGHHAAIWSVIVPFSPRRETESDQNTQYNYTLEKFGFDCDRRQFIDGPVIDYRLNGDLVRNNTAPLTQGYTAIVPGSNAEVLFKISCKGETIGDGPVVGTNREIVLQLYAHQRVRRGHR